MGKRNDWTFEVTFDFVPVPPEKEEAYWEAIRYFADVMADILAKQKQIEQTAE
jgi:hypothetical protein